MQTFAINSEVVMNANFANFRAVYDELTDEVTRARHAFLPDHLRNWLATIDETPDVSRIVEQLQSGLDFPTSTMRTDQEVGMAGAARKATWNAVVAVPRRSAGETRHWNSRRPFFTCGPRRKRQCERLCRTGICADGT